MLLVNPSKLFIMYLLNAKSLFGTEDAEMIDPDMKGKFCVSLSGPCMMHKCRLPLQILTLLYSMPTLMGSIISIETKI